ncbi:DNA polymerase III subunit gamma/tau [Ahrensia marina]|uniref:DNA polymerase III subunit gamma/tau n=1 Tax=Ahrensia marina TaxID=1514904 RepID=A0A0M9GLH6_9HYPH|nr:DNA polymerase III subunit gamma/tau [Ahrensia marina]KPB00543.1 DNA polymerase III subunits gamma and tau [Ahrensia marina]
MNDTPEKATPYRVLARKYRPSDFTGLIGQEPMVRTLTNAFQTGRIAQAWMLTGVRGVGKTTTARILARALNYKTDLIDQPSVDLSTPGEDCQAIMEGRHVDIIEMDAASHTGIDDIKQIIDGVRYAPVSARYKVYIIDEIHMLSDKAFNALLKTLEEPPPHAKFIFATTEIRKVPITVLSRCQRFDLRRVETAEMVAHLSSIIEQEGVEADEASLAMVARASEGSVRDALSILDQAIAHSSGKVDAGTVRSMLGLADRTRIVDLFEHLMAGRVTEALAEFRSQYDVGADPAVILTDLAEFTHLVTRLRFVPGAAANDPSLSPDEKERGLAFSEKIAVSVLARTWQMLLKGIPETQSAPRPVAAAEMVLIRLAHASTMPTLDDALKKLDGAPSQSAPQPNAMAGSNTSSGGSSMAHAVGQNSAPSNMDGVTAGQTSASPVRMVANNPQPEQKQQTEPASHAIPVNSLEDIDALAEKNRDPLMKVNIRKCVRLVSIAPGNLSITLTEDAPKSLAGDLGRKLTEWTGTRWIVSVSREEEGGKTLEEVSDSKRNAMLVDASRDPEIAGILAAFPGAKIIDVRLGADALDDDIILDDGGSFEDDVPIDPDDIADF